MEVDGKKSQLQAYRYTCNKRLGSERNWRICIVVFFENDDTAAVQFVKEMRAQLTQKGFTIKPRRETLEHGLWIQPRKGQNYFFRAKRQVDISRDRSQSGTNGSFQYQQGGAA